LIRGAKGNDSLFGGAGNDTLFGGKDNDSLFGNAGNDILRADGGNDLLDGGRGNDEIRTGAGNDTVVLAANNGTDTIFRFNAQGSDQIQLDAISFGQISLTISGRNTEIAFNDEILAIVVNNINLVEADFITVGA
ncbi:MAG: hypothetical protein WBA10_10025, partial [Elainellaceae cyanobacterium]